MFKAVSLSHWGLFAQDDEMQCYKVGPHQIGGIRYGENLITRRLFPFYRHFTSTEFANAQHQ